jgi:hypothetical protein
MNPSRREVLAGTAALGLLPWRSAVAAPIEPVPLPFDPTRLPGLSEKLLRSHWENNYGGAVKNLAKTREQLAAVTKDTPAMLVAGLMERELTFRNSVVLHELYFANLGGSGGPQGTVSSKLCSGRPARGCTAAAAGSSWPTTRATARCTCTGPVTTASRPPPPCRCWSATCTSTATRWTTGPLPRATSTPSGRT